MFTGSMKFGFKAFISDLSVSLQSYWKLLNSRHILVTVWSNFNFSNQNRSFKLVFESINYTCNKWKKIIIWTTKCPWTKLITWETVPIKKHIFPLEKGGAVYMNKLKPYLPLMLCAKFGWNWPIGSGEEDGIVKRLQKYRNTDGRRARGYQKISPEHSAQIS